MNYTNLYLECLDKIKILLDGKSNKEYEELKKIGKESNILDMSNTIFRCKNLIKELELSNVKNVEIVYVPTPVLIPKPIPVLISKPIPEPEPDQCDIKILSEAVKKYYDKLRNNLDTFVQNTLDRHDITPDNSTQPITFCNTLQPDIQIKQQPKRYHTIIPIVGMTPVTNIKDVNDDAKAKYYLIHYLMKHKNNFITTLIQFLLAVCADIKYNYIDDYYIFLPIIQYNDDFTYARSPDTEHLDLLGMLKYVCIRNIEFYNKIFDVNEYTKEFKIILCDYSNVFVDLFTKLILSNNINLSVGNPIFDLKEYLIFLKTNDITSLVEYSQLMNYIRLDFNEKLTLALTSDFSKSIEMVKQFLYTFDKHNTNKSNELVVKGGNLFKLNLIDYMKNTAYINTYLYKKYNGKPIELSDWDFSVKLACKTPLNYYTKCFNKFIEDINEIFEMFRNTYYKDLMKTRNFVHKIIEKYIKDCDATLIKIHPMPGYDTKTYYSADFTNTIPYKDYNIDDVLNNEKDDNTSNTMLKKYRIITKLNNELNNFKISNVEIRSYTDGTKSDGFDLTRINAKYGITIMLGNNCIKFKSHTELIDIGVDKIGSRRYDDRTENNNSDQKIIDSMYGYVNVDGLPVKSYSILWFIDDIIGIYLEKITAKDAKRFERLIDAIYILYETDRSSFLLLRTIDKPAKNMTLIYIIIEMYNTITGINKTEYSPHIDFIKQELSIP